MSGSGRRGSIWSYLMGRSGETVPDPLVGRISAWRQARQAALIRLERSHEQAMQALASTRDEMHTLRVQPKHVQATAPSIDRGIAAPANDRYAVLLRREEGLQTLCWALLTRLRSAKQEAEALADKTLRARRLVALLDRCRCVYQVRTARSNQLQLLSSCVEGPLLTYLFFSLSSAGNVCARICRTHSYHCMHLSLPSKRCSRPQYVRRMRVKDDFSHAGWQRPASDTLGSRSRRLEAWTIITAGLSVPQAVAAASPATKLPVAALAASSPPRAALRSLCLHLVCPLP